MKKKIIFIPIIAIITLVLITSHHHTGTPSIVDNSASIADFYAFEDEDKNNIVFALTLQNRLSSAQSETANFNQNTVFQINIDNTGDNIEDLVIQAVRRGSKMWFFGPEKPNSTNSTINILQNSKIQDIVDITPYKQTQIIRTSSIGLKYFAGITDDPSFFDFTRFKQIQGGNASQFNNPGTSTWDGLNTLSLVIEVPKNLLGNVETINSWASSYKRQEL